MTRRKILIVDDDQSVRETLADLLELLGYKPIGAADGNAGLSCLEREQVDLVIADIKMPVMDGLEMTRRVKEKYPHLDVILISGYQPDSAWRAFKEVGASDYITKPFHISTIQQKIERILRRREKTG